MKIYKELPLIAIVLLPFVYLAFIWNQLPEKVPMHWNIEGEIDRYGNKTELLLIPILLPFLTYILLLVIPKIDPKNNLSAMGNKLQTIKILLTTFMSILALFIIYSAKSQTLSSPNIVFLLIGILYIILGVIFKSIKANYFIGIRTPWTLESEKVWNKTHLMGGKLWFTGGVLVAVFSLLLEEKTNFIVFLIITGIITIIPIVYSFVKFRKERN